MTRALAVPRETPTVRLRRLGIRSTRDLVLFLLILGYSLGILTLMIGAIARDLGLAMFPGPAGRPIVADLTLVTVILTVTMLSVALLWLVFSALSLRFAPSVVDPNSVEVHSPTVSVLIPAHNEEAVIRELVTDLLDQDYPHLEVIVVAHNCRDRTAGILRDIRDDRLHVLELKTQKAGKALALNHGLRHASGEVVAQFDADNRVLDRKIIRRAVVYFLAEPGTDVIQARIEAKNEEANLLTRLQAVEYRVFSHLFWGGRNAIGLPCPIGGTGVFFRREILERVRGWDNELVEDYDLYCKLVLAGAEIAYKPDLETLDEKPTTWRTLLRQRSRWQSGHMQVLAKRCRSWMGLTDMVYLAAPVANGAWYASTILVILYHILPWSFTYWYPPALLWISMWVAAYGLMALILIRTGHARDIRYLPAFYVFGFHWLLAFLGAFRVKSWSGSKTVHGDSG